MNRGYWYLLFFISVFSLHSCISYEKNLILKSSDELFPSASLELDLTEEYRLTEYDVVYVEVNRLFMENDPYALGDHVQSRIMAQPLNPYLVGIPINSNGFIDVPLIGEVEAKGSTLDELTAKIEAEAKEMYSSANVKVFLLTQNVSVLGEVRNSGRFPYYTENLSVFEAIALSGGQTDFADLGNIKIMRFNGDTSEVFHLNLSDVTEFESSHLMLQNNDVVIVPPQRRKRLVTNNNFTVVLSSVTVLVTVLSLIVSFRN